jgi:hypothetical protein
MTVKTIIEKSLVGILLVLILGGTSNEINAQEPEHEAPKALFSLGFGFFDLLNLGFGVTNNNYQFGLKVGTIPAVEEKVFSFSLDFYYHFGGYSEKAGMNAWFVRAGIQYYSDTGDTYYEKLTYLNTRIGRKFFFSEKFGFEIDAGMMVALAESEYHEGWQLLDFDMTFFPGLGIGFFYRF